MIQVNDTRPKNREVENENQRPAGDVEPPRPATEKPGARPLQGDTPTDAGSGRPR